ncbi:MAG TPA: hypothetical protein VGL38_00460 [bacterium]
MAHLLRVSLLLGLCLLLAGCISVEKKEYHFKLNGDGTGTGTIRFVNILSTDNDGKDVSFKDFAELVTDYLNGTKFEEDYPAFHVTGKKLLEERGQLVGEVTFTFTSLDSAGFLQSAKCDCCPVIYFINTEKSTETVSESSGKVITGVAPSPFIEWEPKTRDFALKTTLMEDTSNSRSMLEHYRSWVKK